MTILNVVLRVLVLMILGDSLAHAQSREFNWGHLHVGDCNMDNAKAILRQDGIGRFQADVGTERSIAGDIWHLTLKLIGINGSELESIAMRNSPTLSESATHSLDL
jgi:hypothetical protein